jgi:SNF2-related domain
MTERVAGKIRYGTHGAAAGNGRRPVWEITAEPDVMIRIKRILPALRSAKSDAVYLADTEANCRELDWITSRWHFEISAVTRKRLRDAAKADIVREKLINDIVEGAADRIPWDQAWMEPALPLRDYQRVAIDLIRTAGGTVIGDELGIGKTAISLGLLENPEARPALAVILTGLGRQWQRELNKFYPGLTSYEIKTTQADKEIRRLTDIAGVPKYDLILINYAKLASWRHHLAGLVNTVIFDEVQELRRPESQKYEAAAHICSQARWRAGLSATPVYNYGGEIFAIIDALNPGVLGDRDEFLREWCSTSYGGKTHVNNPVGLRAYMKSKGLYLRRTLEEVGIAAAGVLPLEQMVPSDPEKFNEMAGDAMEMARLILSQDTKPSDKWRTSSELDWRMRQATGLAKAPFVANFVRMLLESEKKVLLLGWHRAVYDIWLEKLKEFQPVLYTGTESGAGKARSADAFTHGDSRVLIMSLRSGAGLDGLQEVCNTLVFGELDWSPGVHRQAIGRLKRPGQPHDVLAYFCNSSDGSDPVMLDVLNIKAMEAKALTGAGDTVGAQPTEGSENHVKRLAEQIMNRYRGATKPRIDQPAKTTPRENQGDTDDWPPKISPPDTGTGDVQWREPRPSRPRTERIQPPIPGLEDGWP